MNDLQTKCNAADTAVDLWEASQRRHLRFTLWRRFRDCLSNLHLLRAILCLFTLLPLYSLLCRFPTLLDVPPSASSLFGNRVFVERAINIAFTGGALARCTPLALGVLPLLLLLSRARTETMLRGRPSGRTYVVAGVHALLGALILLRWYSLNSVLPHSGVGYIGTIVLLVAGSLVALSIDAVFAATLRVGLIETNLLLYAIGFFASRLSQPDIWSSQWQATFIPSLIAAAVLFCAAFARRKLKLLYVGQGVRRIQEGITHVSLFSQRLGWVMLAVYSLAWLLAALLATSFPGHTVSPPDEWSPLVLTLSLGLYVLLFVAFFRWRHIFYPESPEDLAHSLEEYQFLLTRASSKSSPGPQSTIRPGAQTAAVLASIATDSLRVTSIAFLVVIATFALPAALLGQPAAVEKSVHPLLLTIALLGSVRFLSRCVFAVRERVSPHWLGSQLAARRDIWDDLQQIVRAFELQGLPIREARQELRAAADANFLGKMRALRRILSLLRATENEMSDSPLADAYRTLKFNERAVTWLLVAAQFAIIASLVWGVAVLAGLSFDSSSLVGVLVSLGIVLFQEVSARVRSRS